MAKQVASDVQVSAVEPKGSCGGLRSLARPGLHVLLVLLVVVALIECATFVAQALAYPKLGYDFSIYFAAALALRDNLHANIYSLQVLQSAASAHHAAIPGALYLYPPFLAVCLIPATLLPYGAALAIWQVVCLACWLGGAALVAGQMVRLLCAASAGPVPASRSQGDRTSDRPLFAIAVVAFLALTNGPLMEAFSLGQVTLPIFALVATIPYLLGRRRSEVLTGVLLGFATLVKLFPLVLILYFVVSGRRRVTIAALVTMGLCILAIVPVLGLDGLLATRSVLTNGGANAMQFHNESLARVPMWIAVELGASPSTPLSIAGYLLIAAVFAVFFAGLWKGRPSIRGDASDAASVGWSELIGYEWALATMVLVTPITWQHYDAWLLPATVVCLAYGTATFLKHGWTTASRRAALWTVAGAVAALALTQSPLPFGYDGLTTFSPGPYIAGHPIRPLFMLFRPAAACVVWMLAGLLFIASGRSLRSADTDAPAEGTAPVRAVARQDAALLLKVAGALVASVIGLQVLVGVVVSLARP